MKKIILIFVLFLVFNLQAQDTKKALFIGNSYTGVNNLPSLVESLAAANGDVLIRDQNIPGGFTFNTHSTNATTLNKIASDDWDYVILQAQSQEPSFSPGQVAAQTKPYAVILNDSIKSNNPCTNTLFYMTWGRENGDASNCASYPPICTYEGMQQRLRASYLEMTDENDASVAPVGMAWQKVREDFPAIDLYATDGSHPSIQGSYLAACVFYSSMFHKSTVGNTYWSSLDSLTAYRLQDIASSTVLDSLDIWRIDTSAIAPVIIDSLVSACDSIDVNGNWIYSDTIFSDTIVLPSSNPCDIKIVYYEIVINDGSTEIIFFSQLVTTGGNSATIMLQFEAQDYDSLILLKDTQIITKFNSSQTGLLEYEYTCQEDESQVLFTLVTKKLNCNTMDSMDLLAFCGTTGIIDLNKSNWQISPNPTNNYISIESHNNIEFTSSLIDLSGREVIERTSDIRIDLSILEKGIYFVVIYDKDGNAIGQKKVLKK